MGDGGEQGEKSRSKLLWRTRLSKACNYPLMSATTVSNPALSSRKNYHEMGGATCWVGIVLTAAQDLLESCQTSEFGCWSFRSSLPKHVDRFWNWLPIVAMLTCGSYPWDSKVYKSFWIEARSLVLDQWTAHLAHFYLFALYTEGKFPYRLIIYHQWSPLSFSQY